ncbi:MAG: hypothetical protein K8F91_07720 [Candidatus Obscuribacterales bacterium]|nr:hypothetical protein [Candidatus Obscuribacterales bacterium]
MANSSRTWVFVRDQNNIILKTFCLIRQSSELSTLWFDLDSGQSCPGSIKLDVWDRQTDRHFISETQALPELKQDLPGS